MSEYTKEAREEPKARRRAPVAEIRLYQGKEGVSFVAIDVNNRKVRADEDEYFPTFNLAKKVLHQRYPEAHIR